LKLCPRLVKFGIFDKDTGGDEQKRIRLCLTCPLDKYGLPCVYDHPGAISGKEIKILLGGEG